ncbi:MAG: alpha-E domain-containing protein [Chloroflexota bacterium]
MTNTINQDTTMLLSRVASSCFWLSRYRERAEFTARLLDIQLITLLDTRSGSEYNDWIPLLRINGCLDLLQKDGRAITKEAVLHCLCLDTQNPNSIMSCLRNARENSRQAREQISSEMWEQVNSMYHDLAHLSRSELIANVHPTLQNVKNGALLLQGMADQTMMHGEAWQFIRLGRFIERANTTCRLLAVRSAPDHNDDEPYREAMYWMTVLKSASCIEAYHKTYAAPVARNSTIEFLLFNPESPRSILYCLEHAMDALNYISGSAGRRFHNEADRVLGQMATRIQYLRLDDIDLIQFLDELNACLYDVSDLVMQTYCSYEVA